jgi:hypothetical protein
VAAVLREGELAETAVVVLEVDPEARQLLDLLCSYMDRILHRLPVHAMVQVVEQHVGCLRSSCSLGVELELAGEVVVQL